MWPGEDEDEAAKRNMLGMVDRSVSDMAEVETTCLYILTGVAMHGWY